MFEDGSCRAVILAAGQSSRMGRDKSRLPWIGGQELLPWMMETLETSGWLPLVVLGPENFEYWKSIFPPGSVVLNPDPARGKTSSLSIGVQSLPSCTKWILLTAVDQPRAPALYRRLRAEVTHSQHPIIVPDQNGSRGHPLILSISLREELMALDERSLGLRGFLDGHLSETRRLGGCDPASLGWDLNTPEEYDQALAFFQNQS